MSFLNKTYSIFGAKVKGKYALTVGLIITGLVILAVIVSAPFFQEIFQPTKPQAPPAQFSTGYAEILVYDINNGSLIDNSSVSVHYYAYANDSYLTTTNAGIITKINETSFAILQVTGYWNQTVSVYARNDSSDPYINEFFLDLQAPTDKIDFAMIWLNGSYGAWTPHNISLGLNTILFNAKLNTSFQGNHSYASGWYVPTSERLGNQSYYNVSAAQTWIGFEGNTSFVEINSVNFTSYLVGNITVAPFPTIWTEQNVYYRINATTAIDKVWLFSGQIDEFADGIYIDGTGLVKI